MLPLTEKELDLHQDSTLHYICQKKYLGKSFLMTKIVVKLETIVILQGNTEVQHTVLVI